MNVCVVCEQSVENTKKQNTKKKQQQKKTQKIIINKNTVRNTEENKITNNE